MGIYDRDYYRGEGTRYLDALIPSGQVCKWLIGINVAVFIVQMVTKEAGRHLGEFSDLFILDTDAVLHGQVWRLLTYAFLHEPNMWMHIFFNMLFLWWFGSDLEAMYGPKEFLAFYLTAALVGGIAFTGFALVGSGQPTRCLGASGAITAILVLYAFHFPHHRIYMFMLLPVPIWLFVVFQVSQDAYSFLRDGGVRTSTAVTVHLAGAAFGALYYKQRWHLMSILDFFRSWRIRNARSRLRVYRPDDEHEGEPVSVSTVPHGQELDEHLEAKLDAVLEKVARSGQGSLTENERQILLRASEIYKRKRT